MNAVVKVCIPNTFRDYFDYDDNALKPCIGARVWVPFRKQRRLGIVVGYSDSSPEGVTLKSIESLIDQEPLLNQDLLALCTWIGGYYQAPLSEVIPLALPKNYRLGKSDELPKTDYYELALPYEETLTRISSRAKKLQELAQFLSLEHKPISKNMLSQRGFNSSHLLRGMDAGILALSQEIQLPDNVTPKSNPLVLNEEQADAVLKIQSELQHYHCFLIKGVTGSGKTEVYLQVIDKVLEAGKQVLILVPEIGLTPQLLSRFSARFQQPIAILHSHLNETQRQTAWQLAKEGRVNLVIGTRTAVFTPMPRLGLIVIDEEHDLSLKQMDGVRYSARDTALMRAHLANIPIILGSATPSLESLYNCMQKKYSLLELNQKAVSTLPLHFQLIDLRAQHLEHGIAAPTLAAIKTHLEKNQQVLVFINRRGFAPVLLCHQCGWMADCRACDSHLTFHKQLGQMICHHCGLTQKAPVSCKSCHSAELIPVGAGTQRIHEYLSAQFPKNQVIRIDRDEVSKKNAFNLQLDKIHSGEAQLIVGTQMLAKGHHFPRLSLVVILDADSGLYNQDFRAQEQLGQLLTQVAGRAGREHIQGEVIIQTHLPQHPMLNLLIKEGYDAFAEELLKTRNQSELPPYHYLALIRAQSKSVSSVLKFLHEAKDHIQLPPLTLMGPAPAPMPRKAHQHRMQLLIKSPNRHALKGALTQLREWLTINKKTNGIRWSVDVDPMDLS